MSTSDRQAANHQPTGQDAAHDPRLDRYVRQWRYPPLGAPGQQRLLGSRVLLCGCGALGTVLANTLARAGVGFLRIVDRDFLELNNLQRQVLFDEADVEAGLPKAIAAVEKLRRINSQIEYEPVVADVDHTNIDQLGGDVDLLLDGTDNFETRFLLNDYSQHKKVPWVYGGCLGAEGQTMTILPGETPCLRCLIADPPPPGESPTCDTAGILGPIINIVASLQATEAIKILSGNRQAVNRHWTIISLWDNAIRQMDVSGLMANGCRTCRGGEYPWLSGQRGSHTAVLCGRNSVQLVPPQRHPLSLETLAQKLQGLGSVTRNKFLLRLELPEHQITVFPDGRAIIGGTDDIPTAKSIYARYIGS